MITNEKYKGLLTCDCQDIVISHKLNVWKKIRKPKIYGKKWTKTKTKYINKVYMYKCIKKIRHILEIKKDFTQIKFFYVYFIFTWN